MERIRQVSVPYEITLLSNGIANYLVVGHVSVPYEITLLSNLARIFQIVDEFQYLMKLHYSQTSIITRESEKCFSTL